MVKSKHSDIMTKWRKMKTTSDIEKLMYDDIFNKSEIIQN